MRLLVHSLVISVATACALAATARPAAADSVDSRLQDAYKREFAFLEAEKRQLEARIARHEDASAQRLQNARNELARLQAKVVSTAGEAEHLSELLLAAERDIDAQDQSEDVIDDILVRADAAYEKLGIELPELEEPTRAQLLEQIGLAFDRAPTALTEQGTVRVEHGTYFDSEGVKVEGDILRIGDVASFGLVDGARGPLAPAGGARLKLWPADGGGATAGALARGDQTGTLPLFLYESLDKGIERKKDKTAVEVIETGGVIAWVIVGLGALAALMILARLVLLGLASRGTEKLTGPVLAHLEAGELDRAIALASKAHNPSGRVLTATLDNLDKGREQLEDIVAEAVLHEQPRLSRFGASILVLAAVSPLLGLLGTVTGMISTFEIITEFGTGNPKLLSGGISEALVTTELGLIVAIPALLCGHLLSGWSERIRDRLDAAALAAVNRSAGLRPPDDEGADAVESDDGDGDAHTSRDEIAA